MSFSFRWDAFAGQQDFQTNIREALTNALNKKLPRILEDKITVLNLDWGNEAPSIEMLEIGDVALDRFRGVFKLNYNGGATITVATKVQANLLNVYQHSAPSQFTMPRFVDAQASFPIPLHSTLRNIRLQGTVIVVFCKSKGLTLVFRNDPLQSIEVSSTFDTFPAIASYLQQQIEAQIRSLFREELPAILYQLSLRYLPSFSQSLITDQASRFKKVNEEQHPVTFAEIEAEKPVSLVNMLHVEAMLSSRRTLALETPIIPTAIVRSELHHRSLLTRLNALSFNLVSDDHSVFDELYHYVKHTSMRTAAQKPPRRRVIKLNKPNIVNEPTTEVCNTKGESQDSLAESTETSPLKHEVSVKAWPPDRNSLKSMVQFLPISQLMRDQKMTPFTWRHPQHFMFSNAYFHSEIVPLPVHEIDELPPAYVA